MRMRDPLFSELFFFFFFVFLFVWIFSFYKVNVTSIKILIFGIFSGTQVRPGVQVPVDCHSLPG